MMMSLSVLTITGEPGGRQDEVARLAAQRLGFEWISQTRMDALLASWPTPLAPRLWPYAATSSLARLATEHHLAISVPGSELLFPALDSVLRVHVPASPSRRAGALMLHHGLDRAAAHARPAELAAAERALRRARFHRISPGAVDLVIHTDRLEPEAAAHIVAEAAHAAGLTAHGLLPFATEAEIQFEARLELARHGVAPPDANGWTPRTFSHPSERVFANLLDFYRITWEYEPRSFPLEWDRQGAVREAFTPDFYLPEFNLYVELTTMKQALVTRKNRKVKRLRELYPEVDIRMFYQKDLQDLVMKHGLSESTA